MRTGGDGAGDVQTYLRSLIGSAYLDVIVVSKARGIASNINGFKGGTRFV